jgi:uncharacterized membrane protein YqjE
MDRHASDAEAKQPGLIDGLTTIVKSVFGLAVNRIELAALEFGEARDQLVRVLLFGALGVVAVWFALGCWTALLVALTWDVMGWKSLLLAAAIYSVLACGLLLYARAMLKSSSLSFPATVAELRKDRDALL